MVLNNFSQKTILSYECKIATSLPDLLFGLLIKRNHTLLLKTRFGIHTIGLSKSIDVIVLNSAWKVVKFRKNLPPNRIFFWNPVFNLVIELPGGSIEKSNTKLGDQITKSPPVKNRRTK